MRRRRFLFLIFKFFVFCLSLLAFCEYIVYYISISQCSWPMLTKNEKDKIIPEEGSPLKAMFLADTHLLGPRRGHWFDKLRREWQMHRAFQSAVALYKPEVVFFLGDLFDEGQWCKESEFQDYVKRFYSLFEVPHDTVIYVVPGNHDMGFHYVVHPYLLSRFNAAFNITGVQLMTLKGNHFVLVNSMAMEGDGCFFCRPALAQLLSIEKNFKCAKEVQACPAKSTLKHYSRPIILQHFPMYRKSDAVCNEPDEAPASIKNEIFREKWDCLSRKASEMIYDKLAPRVIITGHTHHGCHVVHRDDIHEYTVPSFSWRNKNNPTFMLGVFSPNSFAVTKCHIPQETSIIAFYVLGLLLIIFWFVLKECCR